MMLWIARNHAEWEALERDLDPFEYKAHGVIVSQLTSYGKPIALNVQWLADLASMSVRKMGDCIKSLVTRGLVSIVNGMLHSALVERGKKTSKKKHEPAPSAGLFDDAPPPQPPVSMPCEGVGSGGSESRDAKDREEQNDDIERNQNVIALHKYSDRDSDKDSLTLKGQGAADDFKDPDAIWESALNKAVFQAGRLVLDGHVPRDRQGAIIAKWQRDIGGRDQNQRLRLILRDCQQRPPAEPQAFVAAAIQHANGERRAAATPYQASRMDRDERVNRISI